ncbi:MAG: UDP-N-acetylmuramate dehydrogenase [Candidatus Levyibacteriota bacterium]|jgi:UDP-N-acetylmuramate dehydrogenase
MFRQNVPLKDYSRYHIGGPAAYFLEVSTKEELLKGLREWKKLSARFSKEKKKLYVLGAGTNLLISEKGFNGLFIHNQIGGIKKRGQDIVVGSGVLLSDLLDFCIANSLSGLEWAGGLPGTIGGAVRGNAGAFGGETKDSVKEVLSLNLDTLTEITRDKWECTFAYRYSIFKTPSAKNEIILSITLSLRKGEQTAIKKSIQGKIDYRNAKHPMEFPSIGSTFKNVKLDKIPENWKETLLPSVKIDPFPVIPAAKFLMMAGVKGKKIGDAQISHKHPNFIINLGNAKSKDVKALINFAKDEVQKKFGVALEEEIIYL